MLAMLYILQMIFSKGKIKHFFYFRVSGRVRQLFYDAVGLCDLQCLLTLNTLILRTFHFGSPLLEGKETNLANDDYLLCLGAEN